MSRLIVGPFNRVEGDLQVQLEIQDGHIQSAEVNAQMYRGFEQILHGKEPMDALVIVPRICGICSVSQSVASAMALADAMQVDVPPNGALLGNLIHAVENVADHFTHFYLFFMPDFTHPEYAGREWYAAIEQRFTAIKGEAASEVLAARAAFMHLLGLFAGKWPHSLTIQPAGVTRNLDRGELLRATGLLAGFKAFLQQTLYGDALDTVLGLTTEGQLLDWSRQTKGDLSRFIHIAKDLALQDYGRGNDQLMSYGAYGFGQPPLFRAGVWQQGAADLDIAHITEDISHSWLQGSAEPLSPRQGVTLPEADKAGAYSWCKAPRLGGEVMEVGALARQVIDGQPLMTDLFSQYGACIYTRLLARMIEIARVVQAMQNWLQAYQPGQRVISDMPLPDEASGIGLTEAARGSLGHWLQIHNGRLLNYQIIAPTTWNFSPRDQQGTPGVLEQALQGTPVKEGDHKPVMVQHIVRSFDPCMVCTVH